MKGKAKPRKAGPAYIAPVLCHFEVLPSHCGLWVSMGGTVIC
eukprot:SAG22_NODE_33_length_27588_cov_104.174652_22_plen_42_part_00